MTVTIAGTMPLGLSLKNIFEKNNIRKVDILINCDVSRSFVDRLFRGKESRFDLVLSIVRYLECDEGDMMMRYCEEITQADNILYAMEYCDRRNHINMLESLYERSEGQTLPELLEMRELYSLSLERKRKGNTRKRLEDILYKVRSIRVNGKISIAYQHLLEIQIYHALQEYKNVKETLRNVKYQKIEDDFFRSSFEWRCNQVNQNINLRYHADLTKTRQLAHELINECDSKYFHAYSYGNLGLSYAFENDDKALSYLKTSQQLYKEVGMNLPLWNETIEFIQVLWGRNIKLEDIHSMQNKAFKLIKEGNNSQALEIIDKLDEVEGESPLKMYLRGLATNDVDYHWKSLEMYIRDRGDRLFSILPYNELIHLKQNKNGVNALYNIIISKK
jgi:hypothetical protein